MLLMINKPASFTSPLSEYTEIKESLTTYVEHTSCLKSRMLKDNWTIQDKQLHGKLWPVHSLFHN